MGIDIYATWRGMTDDEVAAQKTGFSIAHGHVGYLREAYHGEPYATRVLVPEAFYDGTGNGARIRADFLRARLPMALTIAEEREEFIYGHGPSHDETRTVKKSFEDFVALCEAKEAETGEPCRIIASY